jgi:histone-lysine N-methyltransferase SETMAR
VELWKSYYELVPDGRTINAGVYSQQLEKMYMVLVEKYPVLVNQKEDNACPHMAKKTLQKIEELEGIELLPHPGFSPDLAPSDYYLFRSMAQFLHSRKFQSVADVEVAIEEFFASKDKEWFYQAFKELVEKWMRPLNMRACILNVELLLFCMFRPIKIFILNPALFMGHPQ